jgi:predicted component of type VI protein secretion system
MSKEISEALAKLVTKPDDHIWRALKQARGRAAWTARNAKARIDSLSNEIQRHSRDLLNAEAAERAITSHAESMGWTLDDPPVTVTTIDMNQ